MKPLRGRNEVERARGPRRLFLAVVLLVGTTYVWGGLWYEDYDAAEQALRAQEWSRAVDLLVQALAQKGDSSARARTHALNFIAYFPYLKLGIARYNLGEFDQALLALEAEERLGAIRDSERDYAELLRYRGLAQAARDAAEATTNTQIVERALDQAATLAGQGDLDGAIAALGQAAARAPDDERIEVELIKLRGEVARRQERRDAEQRAARLVEEGRTFLAAGEYEEAASRFSAANSVSPSDATRDLLDDAQARLVADLEARQSAEQRNASIGEGLSRARQLSESGEIAAALRELQTVLALEPGNRQGRDLQEALLRAQAEQEQASNTEAQVASLLDQVEASLASGDLERALAAANRVLAVDPTNDEALRRIASAYQALRRRPRDGEALDELPPVILFPDFRDHELNPGEFVERVTDPVFRRGGRILASSFQSWKIFDHEDRLIAERDFSRIPRAATETEGSFHAEQFRIDHEVGRRLTVFRIMATNSQGKSSSIEYPVWYDPPWYKEPWIWAAAAILTLGAAAFTQARRVRRRRQLFKRRFNPYIAGSAILSEDMFFGRERLLTRVLQSVHNNSILLYGERRIGKTSLQHHLQRRLQDLQDPDYRFFPVFTDLQGTPEQRFFSTLAEDLFETLAPHLDGLKPNPALADPDSYGYKEFVRDMREVLKVLKKANEKRVKVVLLIDEVDELNAYDPRINQKLRSLFMRSFAEDLAAVVSGVAIKKHWESEGSPWYNFFEEIRVEPFRREDAVELIERPVRGIFAFEEGAVDRIIELSKLKPYDIQKICVAVVNRLHDEKRRRITVADVNAVANFAEA